MSSNTGVLNASFYDGAGLIYFEEMCMSMCGDLVDPCTGICVTANVWGLPSGEVDDAMVASQLDYHQLAIANYSIQDSGTGDCLQAG